MEAAQKIRMAVAAVALLRQAGQANPALREAVGEVKRLQSQRFAGTYTDLLAGGQHAAATRFFLDELYNDKDYAQRDAQFARIAGAIEKFLPAHAADTAVGLAQLHALTEALDQAMAVAWLAPANAGLSPAQRYVAAWREVGRRADREAQLTGVMGIGQQLARLTRKPGLRMMLRMMRGPASAGGMSSLQRFLERGFDTFAAMAGQTQGTEEFLDTIGLRESALIAMLFDRELATCGTELQRILGQAR